MGNKGELGAAEDLRVNKSPQLALSDVSFLWAGFKSPTTWLCISDTPCLWRNIFALYLTILIPVDLCILRSREYIPYVT
jgi:hypothetical protein